MAAFPPPGRASSSWCPPDGSGLAGRGFCFSRPWKDRFPLSWVMGAPARSNYHGREKDKGENPLSRHDDASYFAAQAREEIRKVCDARQRG